MSYCNSSKVTVASSDTVVIKKCSKIKKTPCENQENELRMTTPDAKVFEITDFIEKAPNPVSQSTPLVEQRQSRNKVEAPPINVQCQCPEEFMNITETGTQYDEYKYQSGGEKIQPSVSAETEARRSSQASKFTARVCNALSKNFHNIQGVTNLPVKL